MKISGRLFFYSLEDQLFRRVQLSLGALGLLLFQITKTVPINTRIPDLSNVYRQKVKNYSLSLSPYRIYL